MSKKSLDVDYEEYMMLKRLMEFCNDMMLEGEYVAEEYITGESDVKEIGQEFLRDMWELVREYNEYVSEGFDSDAEGVH